MNTAASAGALSSVDDWEKAWDGFKRSQLGFDPAQPRFADLHRMLQRTLPVSSDMRFLEIGCFPGNYMWYFNKYYQYQVAGVEYVEACCERARTLLDASGVPGEVMHADFFAFDTDVRWDVVCSVGFIEHFDDSTLVVRKHLDLVRPGGYLVLVIPNHSGIYGEVMKRLDYEVYKIHNLMSYDDMRAALEAAGDAEILEGGYYCRLGFEATGLYSAMRSRLGRTYAAARAPFWLAERLGQLLPNTAALSPFTALVARKGGGEAE